MDWEWMNRYRFNEFIDVDGACERTYTDEYIHVLLYIVPYTLLFIKERNIICRKS